MQIEFVNHASHIFNYDGISLMTDPWIEGKVFQESWSLLSESKFTYEDFSRVTHIWFSHEHPDHFFPPNLKAIPEDLRKNITVLYHETSDKKVLGFCRSLGFRDVVELKPDQLHPLTDRFSLLNNPFGDDSWLYIKTDQWTILNTNDCSLNSRKNLDQIIRHTGQVDLLLTQFSYANKQGNADEVEKQQKAASHKRELMQMQIEAFQPRYFMPMASFVWFSHEENFYLNAGINKIGPIEEYTRSLNTTPIVMYPGDQWTAGKDWENASAIERYNMDYRKIKIENATPLRAVKFEDIQSSAGQLWERLKKRDLIYRLAITLFPLKVYLTDLEQSVKFSRGRLIKISTPRNRTHMITSSEVLNFCFKFNWGFNTTMVNGRFQSNTPFYPTMRLYKNICDSLNHENSLFRRILQKIGF